MEIEKKNAQTSCKYYLLIFSFLLISCKSAQEISNNNQEAQPLSDVASSDNDEEIFHMADVDEQASFPGGESEKSKFLTDNLKYPIEAQESGVEGHITAHFIVRKDGTITDVKTIKDLSKLSLSSRAFHPIELIQELMNEECIRVVKSMPKCKPAKKNGKKVDSYNLQIFRFKLK